MHTFSHISSTLAKCIYIHVANTSKEMHALIVNVPSMHNIFVQMPTEVDSCRVALSYLACAAKVTRA